MIATNSIMKFASEEVHESTVKIHRLVAIAMTRNGHIIAHATNRKESISTFRYSIHAEDFLIKKLKKINALHRYKNIVVVVLRMSRAFGWRLAKPCPRCEGLLLGYGIREIYYTNNFGNLVKL